MAGTVRLDPRRCRSSGQISRAPSAVLATPRLSSLGKAGALAGRRARCLTSRSSGAYVLPGFLRWMARGRMKLGSIFVVVLVVAMLPACSLGDSQTDEPERTQQIERTVPTKKPERTQQIERKVPTEKRRMRRLPPRPSDKDPPVVKVIRSCHPSYGDCLYPHAYDYDCVGGPGLSGRVRVFGRDPYRLDADGDGWGCE